MHEFSAGTFDIAVIGAGHAGIEAALAAARMGCSTICFTINLDAVDILNRQNVVMKDGATLPVSRRQCEKLADAYAARSFTRLRKSHPLK